MESVFRRFNVYVQPTLSRMHRDRLPFGYSLSVSLADPASYGMSTIIYLRSSYFSILAPDRVTLAVPIPLTVLLNRVHCSQRFIPIPFRMVGRILEVELQVALLNLILFNSEYKILIHYQITLNLFRLQHIFMQLHVATNAAIICRQKRSVRRSN